MHHLSHLRYGEPDRKIILSENYWNDNTTWPGRILHTFGNNLPFINGGRILDLGCSEGITTRELAKMFPYSDIFGMDKDHYCVKNARKRSLRLNSLMRRLYFVTGDGYAPPFPSRSFKLVLAMNNLAYIYKEVDKEFFKKTMQNIADLVEDAGYLAISAGQKIAIARKEGDKFVIENPEDTYDYNQHNKALSLIKLLGEAA